MDCDDEMNPFWVEDWSVIDTDLELQIHEADRSLEEATAVEK